MEINVQHLSPFPWFSSFPNLILVPQRKTSVLQAISSWSSLSIISSCPLPTICFVKWKQLLLEIPLHCSPNAHIHRTHKISSLSAVTVQVPQDYFSVHLRFLSTSGEGVRHACCDVSNAVLSTQAIIYVIKATTNTVSVVYKLNNICTTVLELYEIFNIRVYPALQNNK